jgi:hypothetical protein
MSELITPDPTWVNPVIEAYKNGIDVTLIEENLKLTVEERLLNFERTRELYDGLHKAGEELRAKKQSRGE